jgi:signal transduction histidine kinase
MSHPIKVLLVDDDEVDRQAVRRALARAGVDLEIHERTDRESAIAALETTPFDCILLDYQLPGATGLETLRAVRAAGHNLPVITLTGFGDEELAVELMKAGAADYVTKSALTPERLERSLRYALALHQAERERNLLLAREQQARQDAQNANRAKDEFLATLSHELRTPLNAILGWARLLASGNLNEAGAKRAIEIIERNTRLQAQLIEDLLDISRITSGKLRLDVREVPIRAVLEGAIDSVRHSAEAKRITLTCDSAPDGATLVCDPARLQQVIWNLLTNAIKFTPEDGQVIVSAQRTPEDVVITVTDTGAGISAEFLPFVFDRFRQQDGATTRSHGGLGLGLAIVRHLIELHSGKVEASSPGLDQGATFTVTVPAAPVHVPSLEADAAVQPAYSSSPTASVTR